LGLVVLNRRFLVLGKTRMPNLASRSLALAIKALPEHWQQAHGYKPLLAETFSGIEQYHGTCYKVSNWIACAYSGGIRTPIPIESGQESGRCRTALRSLPDRIPAASGQQSGTVRTEFRSDPDNVPGHPDSVGHRPEWGGGKGS